MVREITKPKHEDLAFFIPDSSRADVIPKTMIFINNIENVQRIAKYLYLELSTRF